MSSSERRRRGPKPARGSGPHPRRGLDSEKPRGEKPQKAGHIHQPREGSAGRIAHLNRPPTIERGTHVGSDMFHKKWELKPPVDRLPEERSSASTSTLPPAPIGPSAGDLATLIPDQQISGDDGGSVISSGLLDRLGITGPTDP